MKRQSLFAALAAATVVLTPLVAGAATNAPAAAKPATAAHQTSVSAKHTRAHMAKLDLNTASKDELMKLRGMTDADADKIIAGRPYASVSDLKSKKIIATAEFSKIRGSVTVKKAEPAKK